ncbi:TetR/AcrR family transcriptional regulator [Vallitalea okinawensis]|uniref:TetR/AcrR family transcriptional regulator n=1 Tax=Vallitalea okinawensis TaxID=2078660 RepID=UPI000CFD72B5|nr:TetR/AcrR family transcriptional regulator [Vallitalea okinawensis]
MEGTIRLNQADRILDAAYNCISNKGYANISMRQIAKEAGVALSQLHYYFGSKKDLFSAITRKMTNKYLVEFETHLKKGNTPKESLNALIEHFKSMIIESPHLLRLLYDLTGLALWSDTFSQLLSELFNQLSTMIEEQVLDSQEEDAEYDAKTVARLILSSMIGMSIQVILTDDKESDMIKMLEATELILQ